MTLLKLLKYIDCQKVCQISFTLQLWKTGKSAGKMPFLLILLPFRSFLLSLRAL